MRYSVYAFRLNRAADHLRRNALFQFETFKRYQAVNLLTIAGGVSAILFLVIAAFGISHAWYGVGTSLLVFFLSLFGLIIVVIRQFEESLSDGERTSVTFMVQYLWNELEYLTDRLFVSGKHLSSFIRDF
ncbi:MAG: hypothetical protein NT003_03840 [Candidatus Magasanikbacteria bacterium]|nr:hypothetical protein [Candidatus Magasanikbacteria bacterium]